MNIFNYISYKSIINEFIQANKTVYGYKTKLATACGIQKSFLSQVLGSHIHLTPDHAAKMSIFWELSDLETEYFLELLQFERSATRELREISKRRLNEIKKNATNLTKHFEHEELSQISQQQYYSQWEYAATHMALTIPELRTVEKIAERLFLPKKKVSEILNNLNQMGLVEKNESTWTPKFSNLHIPRDSSLNTVNHLNWRMKAITNSSQNHKNQDSIHYSSVFSLSQKDLTLLQTQILDFISKSREVIKNSKEEELAVLCIDYFEL